MFINSYLQFHTRVTRPLARNLKKRVSKAAYSLVHALVQLGLAGSRRRSATSTRRFWVKSGLVEGLCGLRDIQSRVLSEESIRFQHDANTLHWHDWKVFNARVMSETESYTGVSVWVQGGERRSNRDLLCQRTTSSFSVLSLR